jgi:hypothetical protein
MMVIMKLGAPQSNIYSCYSFHERVAFVSLISNTDTQMKKPGAIAPGFLDLLSL